ncbi:hypothetical protein HGO37_07830 [Rhizobium sp. CG4]|uniref:hypothetical protein n=1 Tax=Rhizobium sp. CG4 TaxID=2726075 RepID=UPI002034002A|nr:hypothetical protein [Rhizobium sp. CG4]MCM2455289.1 hypothetical protein [Rhizobium sp. CG4]
MEKLADLPPTALIALGVTLAFIFVVRHFGLASGEKTGPENKAPIAAVIVDPTALNKATAALEEHTTAIKRHTDVVEDVAKHVDFLGNEMSRIREELRIRREIERSAR